MCITEGAGTCACAMDTALQKPYSINCTACLLDAYALGSCSAIAGHLLIARCTIAGYHAMEWLRYAVEGEVQEVARSAVRALRGIRLCAEGHEEGRLTHLVLGQQRRTLKVCTLTYMLFFAWVQHLTQQA